MTARNATTPSEEEQPTLPTKPNALPSDPRSLAPEIATLEARQAFLRERAGCELPPLEPRAEEAWGRAAVTCRDPGIALGLWLVLAGWTYREAARAVGKGTWAAIWQAADRCGITDLCGQADRVVRNYRKLTLLAQEAQLRRLTDPEHLALPPKAGGTSTRDLAYAGMVASQQVTEAERAQAGGVFGDALGALAETLAQGGRLDLSLSVVRGDAAETAVDVTPEPDPER